MQNFQISKDLNVKHTNPTCKDSWQAPPPPPPSAKWNVSDKRQSETALV